MSEIKEVEKLFQHEIKDLWSAEKMLTDAMPLMIQRAIHPALKMSLAYHLAETDQHRVALELICKQLGFEHHGNENAKMKTILEEGQKSLDEDGSDESIIQSARIVEHYEIAAYRSAAHYSDLMGYTGVSSRLRLTLEEEQQAEGKLNLLSKEVIGSVKDPEHHEVLIKEDSLEEG